MDDRRWLTVRQTLGEIVVLLLWVGVVIAITAVPQ